MNNKKWTLTDILVLIAEVASPTLAVILTCFTPLAKWMETELRLAIIGLGISIPIIILQASLTTGQNKNDHEIEAMQDSVSSLREQVAHLSPVLEQVCISNNDRIKRFAYRRLSETYNDVLKAVNNGRTDNLRPNEYYKELLHLADLIIDDKTKNQKDFTGEVWAMTSFANEEWIADAGYENLWKERLHEIINAGIKTRRLCLISDELKQIISSSQEINEWSSENGSFKSFIGFLEDYYGKDKSTNNIEHFIVCEKESKELTAIKGFFAIRLTNGELHILYGETVDAQELTAQVLFKEDEIKEVRNLFSMFAKQKNRIETRLPKLTGGNGFIDFLKDREIVFEDLQSRKKK